jgi:hypothetical protein
VSFGKCKQFKQNKIRDKEQTTFAKKNNCITTISEIVMYSFIPGPAEGIWLQNI